MICHADTWFGCCFLSTFDAQRDHQPRLIRRAVDKRMVIDTSFSRLLGRPPVMVAGMTPTTSLHGVPLVAACTNAGFYAELAAGGLSRRHLFKGALDNLCQRYWTPRSALYSSSSFFEVAEGNTLVFFFELLLNTGCSQAKASG